MGKKLNPLLLEGSPIDINGRNEGRLWEQRLEFGRQLNLAINLNELRSEFIPRTQERNTAADNLI